MFQVHGNIVFALQEYLDFLNVSFGFCDAQLNVLNKVLALYDLFVSRKIVGVNLDTWLCALVIIFLHAFVLLQNLSECNSIVD